jgi:hypothetical protein
MKRLIAATLLVSLGSLGLAGCTEKKASSTTETTVTTPGGTTTVTTEKEVTKTGENPPAVAP